MSLTSQQYAALADDVYKTPREVGERSKPANIGGASYKRPNMWIALRATKASFISELTPAKSSSPTAAVSSADGRYKMGGFKSEVQHPDFNESGLKSANC